MKVRIEWCKRCSFLCESANSCGEAMKKMVDRFSRVYDINNERDLNCLRVVCAVLRCMLPLYSIRYAIKTDTTTSETELTHTHTVWLFMALWLYFAHHKLQAYSIFMYLPPTRIVRIAFEICSVDRTRMNDRNSLLLRWIFRRISALRWCAAERYVHLNFRARQVALTQRET